VPAIQANDVSGSEPLRPAGHPQHEWTLGQACARHLAGGKKASTSRAKHQHHAGYEDGDDVTSHDDDGGDVQVHELSIMEQLGS
jgi:hypothetical protein